MLEETTTIRLYKSDRKQIKELQHKFKQDTTQETIRLIVKNCKGEKK